MINERKESPVGCCQENAETSPEKVEGEGTSISSEVNAGEKWGERQARIEKKDRISFVLGFLVSLNVQVR